VHFITATVILACDIVYVIEEASCNGKLWCATRLCIRSLSLLYVPCTSYLWV